MKKITLTILICEVMILGVTGCVKDKKIKEDDLKDTYNKVSKYFENEKVDRSNLEGYFLDEENNIVIVELIDNSKEKQELFINQVEVNPKYIKFKHSGSYYTTSGLNFYISKQTIHNDIRFNDYYSINGRTIYMAGNIDEFYIETVNNIKDTLKNYISKTFQTFDDSIKSITDNMTRVSTLRDGGTTIYKSNQKDITIIVCNTLDMNNDVYIGDYSVDYEVYMCK